jgi:hypothetical protein
MRRVKVVNLMLNVSNQLNVFNILDIHSCRYSRSCCDLLPFTVDRNVAVTICD